MGKILSINKSFARLGAHVSVASCIRRDSIKRVFLNNLSFTASMLVYIAANVIDYLFTVQGVGDNPLREANPIIRTYIELFGAIHGVLICKMLICTGVIAAMKVVHIAHRQKRTKLRADYILYSGAILTTLGGSLWLFH